MAVEACMNQKLGLNDSDSEDDQPLVFRRSKPNAVSSELKSNSSSVRSDKQPGKSGTDSRTSSDRGLSDQKGKVVQSSKTSSSSSAVKPGLGTQKSPPPLSRPQKSPPSSTRPSPSPPPPSRAGPVKSPAVNGTSSANHQVKKETTGLVKRSPAAVKAERGSPAPEPVKEERRSPVPVKEEKSTATQVKEEKRGDDVSDDSEDDLPLSSRRKVGSEKGNVSRADEKGKASTSDSEDSDDDKPLSARVSSATPKGNGRATKVESPDDSDDAKPLSSKVQQNGFIKRENQAKTVPTSSVKRPSGDTSAGPGPSSVKKAKFSDASMSSKGKQVSSKEEDEDDDEYVPISKRLNKGASSSKQTPVKKKAAKLDSSKLRKVNQKSKKIMKKTSQYSKSSKDLPESGDGQKWSTLVHNGVIFPPPYKPHGIKMLYNGKPVDLTPEQEEVATMYAVMIETDYAQKEKFNENFFSDWKKILGKNHVIQDFKKCDFRPIYEWHLFEKEKKKQMSKEEKNALKEEKTKLEEKYMWAVVDGVKEKVGNFRVEPPGLFRGRGEHPKMGKLKRRIFPSDITINIGKGAPIPECPIPGQRWKEIRHDNTVTWLAFWNDPINPREFKYVFLAASSSLKGQSDKEKYEKARKLKDYIQDIRTAYLKDFSSKDMTRRQIAVATYLIDRLALRAGNEKDDDEAETVGCCTLKVENVTLEPPNLFVFDFLGKDSIRYSNTFKADALAYKAVEQFKKGKRGSDDLFDKLDTSKLNAHLKELMPGLTAKVFRTYNASITLDDMLTMEAGSGEVVEKLGTYHKANKRVAILCNHQRAVSKNHGTQIERIDSKISDAKAELSELETDLARAKKGKPLLKDSKGKPKRNLGPEAIEKKIVAAKNKINKLELDKNQKEEMKDIALGTSRINYLDPRITVAWCKRNEVPIEKLFNKSLLAKFAWAMDVEPSFRF